MEIRHKAISYAFFLFFMNSYGRLQGVSLRFSMLYSDYIETFRQIIHFHVFNRKICDLPRVALCIKKYHGNHWKGTKSIMTSKNVVSCQMLGTIREFAKSQKLTNYWSFPGSGLQISGPDPESRNREIAKSRNREIAKRSQIRARAGSIVLLSYRAF